MLKAQNDEKRDVLLISHANPEDNEFTQWLALQLAREGYNIWCDLTKLLGGEVFWDDIEEVLRRSAAKVLFVLSRTSNNRDGALREIHLAQALARREKLTDFIIPLHIDDLSYGDITIELTRVNAMSFEKSWAAGLATLLEKLEQDGVPKNPRFTPSAVNEWWRTKFSAETGIRHEPETYLSNWFAVSLPEHAYYHTLARRTIGKIEVTAALPYPAVQDGISLISFAKAADLAGSLDADLYITDDSKPLNTARLLETTDFGKHAFRLLRLAWERMLAQRRLPIYELANQVKSFYFPKDLLPNDKAFFTGIDGQRTYRAMVGYSSRTNPKTGVTKKRYWHFGLEARPMVHPTPAFVMKPHVAFTSDGSTLWTSKKMLQSARRSQCKGWWNNKWRDQILAAMAYLADEDGVIRLSVGENTSLDLCKTPITFTSPVAYTDPQILREEELEQLPEDYGREDDEDDAYADDGEDEQ
ncbi:MAG TPA: toll/interleukin-1 receptor domain-containing protein [Bryobacteraceae bacterium]|jgi:hypothetical protein|nr:toll/interleukin-1 receptor domain-containing protein [Bryobacteraceae bacterium]